MSLCPGGRVAGSDPGLVTLLTAGDGVISDQCPWSCTMLSRHQHQPCTSPAQAESGAPVTTRQYHVCRALTGLT